MQDDWQTAVAPKRNRGKQEALFAKAEQQYLSKVAALQEAPLVEAVSVEAVSEEGKPESVAPSSEEHKAAENEEEVEALSTGTIDDEVEGGEWVTMENLDKHLGTQAHEDAAAAKKEGLTVHVVTSDFAMQNVLIQMGIPLLTLDGKKIHRVKRFKLLCRACHKINKKIDNLCCENCGNATLCKVSVYIN